MNTYRKLPLLFAAALFLASCAENPADSVPSAEVTDPGSAETSADTPEAAAKATPDAPAESASTTTYTFTEESKIGFVGSKVTGSHEGGFESFSGSFSVAGDEPGPGPHHIEIDMTSVWSDNEKLTGHLKSPDFFDVEKFPTSKFTVTGVEKGEGPNAYSLSGELDLHGVTKGIVFPATIVREEDGTIHLDAEFAIKRTDFGIVYPGKPDDLIRDGVVIKLAMVGEAKE